MRTTAAALSVLLLTTACTGGGPAARGSATPTPSRAATSAAAVPSAPLTVVDGVVSRALPRPDRPKVTLTFDARSWRSGQVGGVESVVFQPDLRVCELDFRLWPNKPTTAIAGDRLALGATSVDGQPVTARLSGDGGSQPTLAVLPLPTCAAAGTVVKVTLVFSLTLGFDVPERMGRARDGRFAWFDYAFPLLAWEHGYGWMLDPAVDLYGDESGSEDFDLDRLSVTAPAGDTVTGTGQPLGEHPVPGGVVHAFTAMAVRDVSVAVGRFDLLEQRDGTVNIHLATPAHPDLAPAKWAAAIRRSLAALEKLLGPFPYSDVWITVLTPTLGSGYEFPGGFLVADIDPPTDAPEVITHELAHSYFFGLVGNDQGRDPWLDEAFATWAALVIDGPHDPYAMPSRAPAVGPVGSPMTFWAKQPGGGQTYFQDVYGLGALAINDARNAAGPTPFDNALRNYINAEAHQIARPSDLTRAFSALPKALTVLRAAGAIR